MSKLPLLLLSSLFLSWKDIMERTVNKINVIKRLFLIVQVQKDLESMDIYGECSPLN